MLLAILALACLCNYDYFTLAAVRSLSVVSSTFWREAGIWATLRGTVEGSPHSFISAESKLDIERMRKDRPLENLITVER